jgi:hypothetical protein
MMALTGVLVAMPTTTDTTDHEMTRLAGPAAAVSPDTPRGGRCFPRKAGTRSGTASGTGACYET